MRGGRLKLDKRNNTLKIVLYRQRPETGARYEVLDKSSFPNTREGQKAADTRLAKLLTEINEGDFVEASGLTLKTWMERWFKDYLGVREISVDTSDNYKRMVRKHVYESIGGVPLQKLTGSNIQTVIASMRVGKGLAAGTVQVTIGVLRQALDQAVKSRIIKFNPVNDAEVPSRKQKDINVLDEEQMALLLQKFAGNRLYYPVLLACGTGMRRGEVLALQRDDLDLENCVVKVTKSAKMRRGVIGSTKSRNSYRTVPISPGLAAMLKVHLRELAELKMANRQAWQENDLVFPRFNGSLWLPGAFSAEFGRQATRLGFPGLRFHDLRHSHASQLLRKKWSVQAVAARLGHDPAVCLSVYAHLLPGMDTGMASEFNDVLNFNKGAVQEQSADT